MVTTAMPCLLVSLSVASVCRVGATTCLAPATHPTGILTGLPKVRPRFVGEPSQRAEDARNRSARASTRGPPSIVRAQGEDQEIRSPPTPIRAGRAKLPAPAAAPLGRLVCRYHRQPDRRCRHPTAARARLPVAARVLVGEQHRRRDRPRGRAAARGLADPQRGPRGDGRRAAATALAAVRAVGRGAGRPARPAPRGHRRRPAARRRGGSAEHDHRDRPGVHRAGPRDVVRLRRRRGVRRHHDRHVAADARAQA